LAACRDGQVAADEKRKPANIFFSVSEGSSATSARMRAASSSS
jgi:hypothetical protein